MRPRFFTRAPGRDRQTDASRMSRLHRSVARIRQELADEREGLVRRRRLASADAAFSQERIEGGRDQDGLSAHVDDLTDHLVNCSRRIAALDRQFAFVDQLHERIALFLLTNDPPEDDAAHSTGASS